MFHLFSHNDVAPVLVFLVVAFFAIAIFGRIYQPRKTKKTADVYEAAADPGELFVFEITNTSDIAAEAVLFGYFNNWSRNNHGSGPGVVIKNLLMEDDIVQKYSFALIESASVPFYIKRLRLHGTFDSHDRLLKKTIIYKALKGTGNTYIKNIDLKDHYKITQFQRDIIEAEVYLYINGGGELRIPLNPFEKITVTITFNKA